MWEYRIVDVSKATTLWERENKLSVLGRDGWELVCVADGYVYLKRPIGEKQPACCGAAECEC